MGTNFYAEVDQTGEEVHLGKRSSGWEFLYQACEHFSSLRELVGWLENTPARIVNEYGDEMTPVEFLAMAKDWKGGTLWTYTPGPHQFENANQFPPGSFVRTAGAPQCGPDEFRCDDGYQFSWADFS